MKWQVAIVAMVVLGLGAASMAANVIDGVAAIVNDKVITSSEVLELVQPVDRELRRNFSGQELEEHRRKAETDALNSLIERALIVQEFDKKGYKLPENLVEQDINDIIDREYGGQRAAFVKTLEAENLTLSQLREQERERVIIRAMRSSKAQQTVVVSPYKIEKYYQENIDQFKVGDKIKLRMILIKRGEPVPAAPVAAEQSSLVPTNEPSSTNTPAATVSAPPVDPRHDLAEEILAKLDGGESFENLARAYSEGKEGKSGGDWGWIGRDILRQELNETAFSLKPGRHSRIIETAEGYYILQVDDVKPAHTTPLAEVRDEIEKTLLQEQRSKVQEEWVRDLRAKAYIRLF